MSYPIRLSRALIGGATLCVAALLASCRETTTRSQHIDDITLTARPGTPTQTATPGLSPLGLDPVADGFLYVPVNYDPNVPAPLLVLLHSAARGPLDWFTDAMKAMYDELGIVVLAPESRSFTWDLPLDGLYGPDVEFIDAALAHTFDRINVDGLRIGLGGFSSGASEALGLGVANGDMITHVMAFSPARLFGPFRRGTPSFFVAHGQDDNVVSITVSRDQIVPLLQGVFTDVTFVEFEGAHEVPDDVFRQALDWFALP